MKEKQGTYSLEVWPGTVSEQGKNEQLPHEEGTESTDLMMAVKEKAD